MSYKKVTEQYWISKKISDNNVLEREALYDALEIISKFDVWKLDEYLFTNL
jgi:hypothetical protein